MNRRRVLFSIALMLFAMLVALSGVVLYPNTHDLIVPIDRSALDRPKEEQIAHEEKRASSDPLVQTSRALALAPDPRLVETHSLGLLPRKADNGDRPAEIYARSVDPARLMSSRPKLAIAILNSGISEIITAEAYLGLPPDISFVMSPYAHDAERQMRDIRNRGHEVFLSIQAKTEHESHEDRGPYALDPAQDTEINRERLHWMMSRLTGYVGLIADLTPAARQNETLQDLIKREATHRGLTRLTWYRANSFETSLSLAPGGKAEANRIFIMASESPAALKAELDALFVSLKTEKQIMAFIAPSPLALEALQEWLADHSKDEFDLIPLSALMRLTEQI